MKFLHTADWQIGMKAVHVGSVGQRVHDERLAAAHRERPAALSQPATTPETDSKAEYDSL